MSIPSLIGAQQGRYIVSVLDDHDMSSRSHKERFAAHGAPPVVYLQTAHVVGVQLTTPGMPPSTMAPSRRWTAPRTITITGAELRASPRIAMSAKLCLAASLARLGRAAATSSTPDHPNLLHRRHRLPGMGATGSGAHCAGAVVPARNGVRGLSVCYTASGNSWRGP